MPQFLDVKATEGLARTARKLHEMRRDEWMNSEQAARYLQMMPDAFEKLLRKGEIPNTTSRSARSSTAARR